MFAFGDENRLETVVNILHKYNFIHLGDLDGLTEVDIFEDMDAEDHEAITASELGFICKVAQGASKVVPIFTSTGVVFLCWSFLFQFLAAIVFRFPQNV